MKKIRITCEICKEVEVPDDFLSEVKVKDNDSSFSNYKLSDIGYDAIMKYNTPEKHVTLVEDEQGRLIALL